MRERQPDHARRPRPRSVTGAAAGGTSFISRRNM